MEKVQKQIAAGLAVASVAICAAAFAQAPDNESTKDQAPSADALLNTPVTTQRVAGGAEADPVKSNVKLDDPDTIQLGMQYFNQFNCAGCHAPNGAGGMGPSLSNRSFVYGRDPANIFLTIQQGRPNGMPAWGELLTNDVIWRIVAYVRSISNEPDSGWGRTISADGFEIEQVPAQQIESATPWKHTQPFSYGQPPFDRVGNPAANSHPDKNGPEESASP